jgi:tripartite ATP-independent transporter DctP family solute receptor
MRSSPFRIQAALTVWAGCVLALCACSGGDRGDGEAATPRASVRLTFPHILNAEHPVAKAIEVFKDEVEKRSGGSMTVRVFHGGTMGNEQELVDNVAAGSNDLTKISSTVMETRAELAKVYSMPYLFRDSEHYWKVLAGEIGRELLDMAADDGLKGICYFDAGARSFYGKAAYDSPSALRGVKIRVQKSIMMDKIMAALGALPQQIDFAELYTALDTGVVDGAENNIPSYYTTQHYKVAPYFVFDEHVRLPDMVFMNAKKWDSLTPEQQKIIEDSAAVAVEFQRKLWEEKCVEYEDRMRQEGVTFIRPDKTPFVEATRSIYDDFKGTEVMDYVERIRAVE